MSISHPLKNINYRNQEMSSFWFKFKNGNQDYHAIDQSKSN
jgi:hypothetical protein